MSTENLSQYTELIPTLTKTISSLNIKTIEGLLFLGKENLDQLSDNVLLAESHVYSTKMIDFVTELNKIELNDKPLLPSLRPKDYLKRGETAIYVYEGEPYTVVIECLSKQYSPINGYNFSYSLSLNGQILNDMPLPTDPRILSEKDFEYLTKNKEYVNFWCKDDKKVKGR